MSSIISSLLDQLYKKADCRCLNIGLDASGKTTILYKMKLGEVVTTIPTIGFNVETISYKNISFTIWDVGGCDKIRPLWKYYYQNTQALIFIIDSNDLERLDDVKELFSETITAEALSECAVLVFFNKIDIATTARKDEMKRKMLKYMEPYLHHRVHHVVECCATSGEGLYEGFDWLAQTIVRMPAAIAAASAAKATEPTEKDRMETQLEEWLARPDSDDDTFLSQLADYTLDNWDHYTHLRIAFVLLQRHGRTEGMRRIFAGIKSFIENSPRTRRGGGSPTEPNNRGTTFHETMTYFWVHMVHYAIESARFTAAPTETIRNALTGTTAEVERFPSTISPWKRFLLMNPQLANGGLFLHYYSKQRMLMDPDSRAMVLLPDKVPLPSLLVDVDRLQKASQHHNGERSTADQILPRQPLTDRRFEQLLAQDQLPGWGHEVKLRVIFLLLCRWGISAKSKQAILDVLRAIEKSEGFHYTISYFWVHMVAFHIAAEIKGPAPSMFSFASAPHVAPTFAGFNGVEYVIPEVMTLAALRDAGSSKTEKVSALMAELKVDEHNVSAVADDATSTSHSSLTFLEFLSQPHCQPLRNSQLYSKYFSRSVVDQATAATDLALPDLKQLPSAV